MWKIVGFIVLLFSELLFADIKVPPLKGIVNDYANIIPFEYKVKIERELKSFFSKSTIQIAILTVPSLEGLTIEEYSIKVADKWKLGTEKDDNGILILVAPKEKKVRIEVGQGLEHVLTDVIASRIIRNVMIPYFKEGNFGEGLYEGVKVILQVINGEYKLNNLSNSKKKKRKENSFIYYLVILIFILFSFWGGYRRRRAYYYGGVFYAPGDFWSNDSGNIFIGGGGSFGGGGASGSW